MLIIYSTSLKVMAIIQTKYVIAFTLEEIGLQIVEILFMVKKYMILSLSAIL
jgi:hypothetical protein